MCSRNILLPPLYNPGTSADPVLSRDSFSLCSTSHQKVCRKQRGERAKRTPFSPALAAAHRGKGQAAPCRERHPQSPHCALTLHGWCCTRAGCSSARGHRAFGQLGQEAASFPFKQRLIRQRQVFETCFECSPAKASHKQEWGVSGSGCREQGENASARVGSSMRQRHWKWGPLPFRGEGFSFMELFCSPCSANPAFPLSVRESL